MQVFPTIVSRADDFEGSVPNWNMMNEEKKKEFQRRFFKAKLSEPGLDINKFKIVNDKKEPN